jgi:hypothetical protein
VTTSVTETDGAKDHSIRVAVVVFWFVTISIIEYPQKILFKAAYPLIFLGRPILAA